MNNQGLFSPIGMPNGAPADMSNIYPQGNPFETLHSAPMPYVGPAPGTDSNMPQADPNGAPPEMQEASYTGNPMIDRYIQAFIS